MASLIIGLSLLVATVSWAGFTLSRTILDPGRSERLAEQLLDNPQVREALVGRLADAVETQIPPEVPVSRGLIEAGAETALDDPQVRALVVDGFVRYHRNALEGEDEPVVIDASALGSASRSALVAVRPELDQVLPATPAVAVELPTTGFTWLASLKDFVDRFTLLGALVAAAGAGLALAVARDRGSVLRRVAFWGYGAAAFWLLVGFGVPRLADLLSPTSGAIASAAVDVFFGAMIRPAVILAIASTGVLLLGFGLPVLSRQRAARMVQPRRPAAGGGPARPGPVDPATRAGAPVGTAQPAPTGPPPLVSRPDPTRPDPTRVAPAPGSTTPRPAAASPGAPPGPATHPGPARPLPSPGPAQPSPATVLAEPHIAASPAGRIAGIGRPGPDRTSEMPRPDLDRTDRAVNPGERRSNASATDDPSDTPTTRVAPAWEEGVGYVDDDGGPSR